MTWKYLFGTSIVFVVMSCVDRLETENFVLEEDNSQIVIDGFISDQPGPYFVRVFKPSAVDDVLNSRDVINAKQVTIFDDQGNKEILAGERGLYYTNPSGIRGVVGNKYWVEVELLDSRIFKSTPDEIVHSGTVDSVYVEFESNKPLRGPTEYYFNVFLDASTGPNSFVRWKYTGIYYITTQLGGCWSWRFEQGPQVSDGQVVQNGKFKSVPVGTVRIDEYTFYSKFMVRIEQMSLSREAFYFWKAAADQFDSKESLFQPGFGSLPTNIYEATTNEPALGIFYATSINKKNIFLTKDDVPVPVPPYTLQIDAPCVNVFAPASAVKPIDWVE